MEGEPWEQGHKVVFKAPRLDEMVTEKVNVNKEKRSKDI